MLACVSAHPHFQMSIEPTLVGLWSGSLNRRQGASSGVTTSDVKSEGLASANMMDFRGHSPTRLAGKERKMHAARV